MLGAPLAVGTEARRSSLMGNSTLPAYREHLTRIESLRRKQDKPVTFPTKGRNAVRRIDSVAGMRKEKKRRPRGNGVDTGCVSHIDNIHRTRKRADVSLVLHTRELEESTHEAMQMTTVQTVGAASRDAAEWFAIDWQAVNRNVRRLQVRIVQAIKAGRRNKVKALQRLLTCSYSGKVLAVRRVTENAGKKTPGVDGEIWDTPQKKARAVHALKRKGYQAQPLRRVYIPKKSDSKAVRPLGIPTMKDRAMQALHLLALAPIGETIADPNSYGFRQQRSCADAIDQCFLALRNANTQWILEGDIKACFDTISKDWLLTHVPMDKVILEKWLTAGYMDKRVLHETTDGTPQGGIISPALANCALDGLERLLRDKYPTGRALKSFGGLCPSVNFIRYADDFVITGRTKELLEGEIKPIVEQFLQERGLELSPTKTVITHVEKGFDFRQNVRRYPNGKLRIQPSKKNGVVSAIGALAKAI